MADVFDDLRDEYEQLDAVLTALAPEQWAAPSAAAGWSVGDVVLHLAQTEELALASAAGGTLASFGGRVDALADDLVADQRGLSPADLLSRWRAAATAVPDALRAHPRGVRLAWVAGTLSPATLATTRLAEHWAHAFDITAPLGIPYPPTGRLRHIAWLGHRTLPYAFEVAGEPGGPIYCELAAPDGTTWTFGDPASPSAVTGPAADFCLVGARRLTPADSALKATGPYGEAALRVLRNYAD